MAESPFAKPTPGLRIKEFSASIPRMTAEEAAKTHSTARHLLDYIWAQHDLLLTGKRFSLNWIYGRHFLLAGATGPGLGGSIEAAARRFTTYGGSVTVIARDITRSVGFEMGKQMVRRADHDSFGDRYHLQNDGMAIEGPSFEKTVAALREAGANDIIYINSVAAAQAGLQPGYPPVYVKDVDDEGIFQWELQPLPEQAVKNTKYVMGELAVAFPRALEKAGFRIAATCYIDWRGSVDLVSRDPSSRWYGRQGAYSTSLFLPKDFLHADTREAYGTNRIVMDCFLPIMRTRALPFIPGGVTMSRIFDKLMELEGVRRINVPELALGVLERIGRALKDKHFNPFPRVDAHEVPLDEWFAEVVTRLNNDENSDFYWKRWMKQAQFE